MYIIVHVNVIPMLELRCQSTFQITLLCCCARFFIIFFSIVLQCDILFKIIMILLRISYHLGYFLAVRTGRA